MSNENRLPDYTERIVQAATLALTFTEGMDEESFLDDIKTQTAVAMCLINIGETASRIIDRYPDFAREKQDIPWRKIRGLRNYIAHDYFELDFETVWQVVENDLAPLIRSLEDSGVD